MMRSLQASRTSSHRTMAGLWCVVLLCISFLSIASTAQACHAHGAALHLAGEKATFSAPLDECPLCAAPHAALIAEPELCTASILEIEPITCLELLPPFRATIAYDLFSRPPPPFPAVGTTSGTGVGSVLRDGLTLLS